MRLFNHNQTPSPDSIPSEQDNPWDDLRHVQSPSESPSDSNPEQPVQPNPRQERKAINMIIYGPKAFAMSSENTDDFSRLQAFAQINNGGFTPEQQSRLLRYIKTPDSISGSSPDAVFQKLDNRHSRRILAYVNDIPDTNENLQLISSAQISSTLERYPTPVEFAGIAEAFLNRLKETNTPQKYQQYVHDLEIFKHQIYGKRQEYYDVFQSLISQAAKYADEQAKRTQVLNTLQAPPSASNTLPRSERSSNLVDVFRLNPAESAEFLRTGRIDGDPFVLNQQSYHLTPEYLQKVGLHPEYKISLDPQTDIAFSKIYHAEDHDAVTAYVHTTKGTKIVSYYRSNSQGVWRYLPDYTGDDKPGGTGVKWLGKGYSEESLNLPFATQAALERISAEPHLQQGESNPFNSSFVFAGTAKRYEDKVAYRKAMLAGTLRGDHYQEVASAPQYNFGNLSETKRPPEELDLTGPTAPDFSRSGPQYQFPSSIYGTVNSEHYPSHDNALLWTFNRDQSGHAWVGGVEVASPISSDGLHTQWAQAGDYGTPLYEYQVADGGYGDPSDRRGRYVNMWNHYLSHMPIIQKYLHRNHPTPTDAEINPRADSESYWPPEVKASTPPPQPPTAKKGFFARFRK